MSDQKISELTTYTTAADSDLLVAVENASGSTKKITRGNVLKNVTAGSASGDVATIGGTETLTGKTLTSPTITNKTSTGTDSGTETLTNKTLTTPVINGAVTGTITPPKTFYGTNFNSPEGFLLNGVITPSVASNNLTVAIKTLAGNDPSASDPVYCRIGGVVRSITSALSWTKNAGTNYANTGGAELATKEVDWFCYLGWNTNTSLVELVVARIPYATLYSDFNASSAPAEKFPLLGSAMAATDTVVNIGRFAATLSAGAGYTWTVPTFTASNLIQRPIYETRWLDWVPTLAGSGSMTFGTTTVELAKYKIGNSKIDICLRANGTTGGSASTHIKASVPFKALTETGIYRGGASIIDTVFEASAWQYGEASNLWFYKSTGGNWGLAAGKYVFATLFYEI